MAEPPLTEAERLIAGEAFRRGATVAETVELLVGRRTQPLPQLAVPTGDADARTVALLPPQDPSLPLSDSRPGIEILFAELAREVDAEFGALPRLVRNGFLPLAGEDFRSAAEKYRSMRSVYYRAGWRCPHQVVFRHIVPATFFGRPVIGGIHLTMLPLLARVESFVTRQYPAAAQQMREETYSVGGFVPRHIAGESELSNHAFGMALDIDPDWNPMAKGKPVLDAFRRATGVEFGQWLFAASSVDAFEQTYRKIVEASTRLMAWLRVWLTAYNDELILREDLAKALRKASTKAAATARMKELNEQVRRHPDRHALQVLIDAYQIQRVRAWADRGIVTIPPGVIRAWLDAHPFAQSGLRYQHSKDVMHLEVLAAKALAAARTGRPAGVADLLRGEPPASPACPDINRPELLQLR